MEAAQEALSPHQPTPLLAGQRLAELPDVDPWTAADGTSTGGRLSRADLLAQVKRLPGGQSGFGRRDTKTAQHGSDATEATADDGEPDRLALEKEFGYPPELRRAVLSRIDRSELDEEASDSLAQLVRQSNAGIGVAGVDPKERDQRPGSLGRPPEGCVDRRQGHRADVVHPIPRQEAWDEICVRMELLLGQEVPACVQAESRGVAVVNGPRWSPWQRPVLRQVPGVRLSETIRGGVEHEPGTVRPQVVNDGRPTAVGSVDDGPGQIEELSLKARLAGMHEGCSEAILISAVDPWDESMSPHFPSPCHAYVRSRTYTRTRDGQRTRR